MSGARVWVDENDLRLVLDMTYLHHDLHTEEMFQAERRVRVMLDPPPPPPLRPYRACMQGHGA